MDRKTLDDRCAELKARMLAERYGVEGRPVPQKGIEKPRPASATSYLRVGSSTDGVRVSTQIRNPHPLVKAALGAVGDIPEDYGKLQFRRRGYLDVRVSKALVRRILAIMDALIKQADACGLKVQLAARDRSYYSGGYTYITDGREQVQITITEKTYQRENPAWNEKARYSVPRFLHHPGGRATLVLDNDSYRLDLSCPRKWSDAKGHVIEEYIDEAISSIRQALLAKHQARILMEEERQRVLERQKILAEESRQKREEEQRFEDLKRWAQEWSRCERMRAFMAAWEHAVEAQGGPILSGSLEDGWRRWAGLLIDRLDPLIDP
jgi:hypothetical protein